MNRHYTRYPCSLYSSSSDYSRYRSPFDFEMKMRIILEVKIIRLRLGRGGGNSFHNAWYGDPAEHSVQVIFSDESHAYNMEINCNYEPLILATQWTFHGSVFYLFSNFFRIKKSFQNRAMHFGKEKHHTHSSVPSN